MIEPDSTLAAYGWNNRFAALFSPFDGRGRTPGRIVRHDRGAFLVATPGGIAHLPSRRSTGTLTVGDWVVVEDGAIGDVLERASLLRRRDPDAGEQLLAANVDVVAMVLGADRPVKAGRLYRTRTQIWDAGANPLVVLTKTDLLDGVDSVVDRIHEIDALLDVMAVCSFNGDGLAALREHVAGRTLVLIGESGAGKSTLVNALVGGEVAAVSPVRATDHRGRHTTTARELHLLPGGGVLIDTPGLREVGLWTDESAVDSIFPEIEDLADECHFRDCTHGPEPGCAVVEAVAGGRLTEERYAAWVSLRREAESAARRADEHARRAYERKFGRVAKEAVKAKTRSARSLDRR